MFTISIAMIIKDEEKTLDRILCQASKFADEIIIVDTGSIDHSKVIAQKYTHKVYDFAWIDNFAEARNFAFSLATKDYIMWLDADDYISNENIQKIINLKRNSNTLTDIFMCKYLIGDNFEFFRERIIKRSKNYTWNGAVHEVITPSGKITYSDIIIEHKKEKISPPKRNLKIYNKLIRNNIPLSPRELYYYARELYYNKYYKKSITVFNKYLKTKDSFTPNIISAYITLSDNYLHLSEYNKGIQTLFACLKKYLPTPEILCKLANLFEKTHNPQLSIYWYESALTCPRQTQGFINKDYDAFIPAIELSRLYFHSNKTLAKKYHNIAKSIKPQHSTILYNDKFFQ